ncbi:MAG: hypothetical protein ACRDGD_07455 [Candidatus Limnocylindria bacterium]
MERLHYRSTSLLALQAELHQRDLMVEAERPRLARRPRAGRPFTLLGLPIRGRRPAR